MGISTSRTQHVLVFSAGMPAMGKRWPVRSFTAQCTVDTKQLSACLCIDRSQLSKVTYQKSYAGKIVM